MIDMRHMSRTPWSSCVVRSCPVLLGTMQSILPSRVEMSITQRCGFGGWAFFPKGPRQGWHPCIRSDTIALKFSIRSKA